MEIRMEAQALKVAAKFLIFFLCASAALLSLWWFAGRFYQDIVFICGKHILLAMGYTHAQIYAVRLQEAYLTNFNIVALLSLAIATPSLRIRERFKMLAYGIPLLFTIHLTDFVAHFPAVIHNDEFAKFIVLSIGVVGMAAPFVVWFCISYDALFKPLLAHRTAVYQCPVCNVETHDIIAHIVEAHGKKAIKSRKVREFLKKHPELNSSKR